MEATRTSILLLGGSFNPAHAGHLYISREAMKRLGVRETWWLVSPGNPLKDAKEMASFEVRLAKARDVAQADRRITVSDFEMVFRRRIDPGLRRCHGGRDDKVYTIDTLRRLKQRYPQHQFIWLMGADNLAQFHRWKGWEKIFTLVPIAVVDRSPFAVRALHSKAAARFSRFRQKAGHFTITGGKMPRWSYLFLKTHPLSATSLRKRLGKEAFLVHN